MFDQQITLTFSLSTIIVLGRDENLTQFTFTHEFYILVIFISLENLNKNIEEDHILYFYSKRLIYFIRQAHRVPDRNAEINVSEMVHSRPTVLFEKFNQLKN